LLQAVVPLFVVIVAPLLTENLGNEKLWRQFVVAAVFWAVLVAFWAFFGGWFLARVDNFNPRASEQDLVNIAGYIGSISIDDRANDSAYFLIDEKEKSQFSDPETTKEFSAVPPELTLDGKGERYWPAALGTIRLLVRHQKAGGIAGKPLVLKRVRLLWTDDRERKILNQAEEYIKTVLRRIDPSIEVDFTSDGLAALTSPRRLVKLYEEATEDLKKKLDQDTNVRYIGIDATAGTVLHSLAGAKAAEDLDARLIYNVARSVSDHESFLLCVDV